ncbi:hypothetical protein [Levilactobacillus fuyuanensis]|uniref:Uncharacterized protein n=1 Tax=Levilactobacillus fuyuanensis TaxID=2486022 RepID=A0ABW4H2A5_9LACO|nr:hypothetical protein [Levilactobacillus fuyuanensis]
MTMVEGGKLKQVVKVKDKKEYDKVMKILLPTGSEPSDAEKARIERAVTAFKKALETPDV